MTTPTQWRKSSCSGGGEGNDCVEISDHPTQGTLTFPTRTFTTFVAALKAAR
ncbi:DUF397 domain-containing protein [Streptomyces sp. NPDC059639]|uniref:DUF397 domain-containing protein n=1 Tax=Streptomyces sp. NPDC059639 TaxID=3346891 RepID=UPI0036CF4BB3